MEPAKLTEPLPSAMRVTLGAPADRRARVTERGTWVEPCLADRRSAWVATSTPAWKMSTKPARADDLYSLAGEGGPDVVIVTG